jgi:hypothetical protein
MMRNTVVRERKILQKSSNVAVEKVIYSKELEWKFSGKVVV